MKDFSFGFSLFCRLVPFLSLFVAGGVGISGVVVGDYDSNKLSFGFSLCFD